MFNYEETNIQWITNKPIKEMSDITKKIIDHLSQDEYFQGVLKLNDIISKQNPNLN
jgi:disulfide oxidoreductase YuzD